VKADRDDVTAVLTTQAAEWNRGDIDGFMAGYADDVLYVSAGAVIDGRVALRAHYQARIAGQLALEVIDVRVYADTATVLGRYALDRARGVFTLVFSRRPEGWRIVHDHTLSDPPSQVDEVPGPAAD